MIFDSFCCNESIRGGENESKLLAADNEEQQSDCESMKLLQIKE